jgi:hypothetical protein
MLYGSIDFFVITWCITKRLQPVLFLAASLFKILIVEFLTEAEIVGEGKRDILGLPLGGYLVNP